jgi:calpain-7
MSTLAANVDPTVRATYTLINIHVELLRQRLYDSAARAEQARDWDTAFRLYVRAAEAFLRESRAAAYETRRSALKAEASKALTRAEKIKAIKGQTLRPVVRDPFAAGTYRVRVFTGMTYNDPEEQARVLQRSSMSNGLCVPLWDDPRPTL